jgi:hypothetical protein
MLGKPKPKITAKDDILSKHVFDKRIYMQSFTCGRCGQFYTDIEQNKLKCISEARAAGNAAIRRIVG